MPPARPTRCAPPFASWCDASGDTGTIQRRGVARREGGGGGLSGGRARGQGFGEPNHGMVEMTFAAAVGALADDPQLTVASAAYL
jgi:hypothetical protein